MLTIKNLKRLFRQLVLKMTWPSMIFLTFGQTAVTYFLFYLAEESTLINHPIEFFYYNMVVISTVGFGDFSPITHAGKAVVSFWQIPSGLIVFASLIGKVTQLFINIARRHMDGSNDFYHYDDHILILCWDDHSTRQIVALILGDEKRQKRQILLCVTEEMKNPFPDNPDVSFARIRTFSDKKELYRVGISKAKRIIVDGKSDDETLSIALSIATFAAQDANISAHFFDKTKAQLLKMHCPHIECSIDNSAKMMVRSMQDPGSSQVTDQLLSTLTGATLYSLRVPKIEKVLNFDSLFNIFRQDYAMTLIGLSHFKNGDGMLLNPPLDQTVKTGDYLYYIAFERMAAEDVDWNVI
jgi:voltage-gated potassium channel